MKRNIITTFIFSIFVLTITSCIFEREEVEVKTVKSDNIVFGSVLTEDVVVTGNGELFTPTKSSYKQLKSENGDVTMPLTIEVQQGINRSFNEGTKAAIITDKNNITELDAWDIYSKYTDATHSELTSRSLYFDDMTDVASGAPFVKDADGIFYPASGFGPYLWINEPTSNFDFVAVTPSNSGFKANINVATSTVTFDYEVPDAAADQMDIMVANPDPVATSYGESVPLTFRHVLAAVNVKVGSVPSGTITSIKFTGVYNKGSYYPSSNEWTNRNIEDGGEFNVALPESGISVGSASNGTSITTEQTSFMMIPQQLFTGAEIVVSFIPTGRTEPLTLRASIQGDVWEMNTTTNYLINISDDYKITIVPLDKILDSHYIITKVELSCEFPIWKLTATANDGADVTVVLEQNLNPMAQRGFWTDRISTQKDGNGNYILSDESARGSNITAGTQTTSQIVSVFIPENITGNTRTIKLTLEGGNALNNLTSKKELLLTQNSIKWLQDPYGTGDLDTYWGCELLIEHGQVPWGFFFDDLNEDWRAYGKVTNQPPGWHDKILQAMRAAGLNVEELMSGEGAIKVITRDDHKSTFLLRIDYGELVTLDVALDDYEGLVNTYELYSFEGINVLSSIKDFLIASAQAGNKGLEHVPGTFNGEIDKTLDYAAMYAMKRNRFNLYTEVIDTDAGDITMYVPFIESKDFNWYLPATNQFPCFINTNWGQSFSFNDLFWTSTAYTNGTDNAHAYAYLNGVLTLSHRNDPYLTFAIRQHTLTGNVEIPINPGDVVKPGEGNGPEYGEGGDGNGDTGGDISGNS